MACQLFRNVLNIAFLITILEIIFFIYLSSKVLVKILKLQNTKLIDFKGILVAHQIMDFAIKKYSYLLICKKPDKLFK